MLRSHNSRNNLIVESERRTNEISIIEFNYIYMKYFIKNIISKSLLIFIDLFEAKNHNTGNHFTAHDVNQLIYTAVGLAKYGQIKLNK